MFSGTLVCSNKLCGNEREREKRGGEEGDKTEKARVMQRVREGRNERARER